MMPSTEMKRDLAVKPFEAYWTSYVDEAEVQAGKADDKSSICSP